MCTFPWQQWLRERAAVLRSMYIVSLVIKPELRNNFGDVGIDEMI